MGIASVLRTLGLFEGEKIVTFPIFNSFLSEYMDNAKTVTTFYATSLTGCVGPGYQSPSLPFLAQLWFRSPGTSLFMLSMNYIYLILQSFVHLAVLYLMLRSQNYQTTKQVTLSISGIVDVSAVKVPSLLVSESPSSSFPAYP